MTYKKYGKGWYNESERHRLARKGIKTRKKLNYALFGFGKKKKEEIITDPLKVLHKKGKYATIVEYQLTLDDIEKIDKAGWELISHTESFGEIRYYFKKKMKVN